MQHWMRFIRVSGILTLASNALAMLACVPDPAQSTVRKLWDCMPAVFCVMLASVGLYVTGMVWNNLVDEDRDRVLHPNRPLVTGAVQRRWAVLLGLLAPMVVLLATLALSPPRGIFLGGCILSLIMLYNLGMKTIPYAGSVVMGLIRACHAMLILLALGTETFDAVIRSILSLMGQCSSQANGLLLLSYPLLLGAYILGTTLISEMESRPARRLELMLILPLIACMLFAVWGFALTRDRFEGEGLSGIRLLLIVLAFFATMTWVILVGRPWIKAWKAGKQALVGPITGKCLMGIFLFDLTVACLLGVDANIEHPFGAWAALGILLLLPIFLAVSRRYRMD